MERLRSKEGEHEKGEAELERELRAAREELASLRPKVSQVIIPFIFFLHIWLNPCTPHPALNPHPESHKF